ncbi:MAG: exosortase C-terminal domain/associated protein EpsI [Candidatus Sulfotelmatobacter sp.]
MRFDFRFAFTVAVLAGTALFLERRPSHEVLIPRPLLDKLPHQLGAWRGTDVPIPADELATLGSGDFLLRSYQRDSFPLADVDLFMAYFPSQRAGDTIHSPKDCLPGSGWFPLESSRVMLTLPGHVPFLANRYLVAKGGDRALVLYWYWAHDRAVASEYRAKFYLVADAIRLNRTDGALIRVSTPLDGEGVVAAQERLVAFSRQFVPLINTYVPP